MSSAQSVAVVPKPRVEWVDAVRGMAIVLVVLQHTVMLMDRHGLIIGPWVPLNHAFVMFRMPLFFFASGLFATSVISRSWPELWRTRLSLLIWAYVLWRAIFVVYFSMVPVWGESSESPVMQFLVSLVAPSSELWFLYDLAIFFVAAKLLRGWLDYRIQLLLSAVMSMVFLVTSTGNIGWNGAGKYFFFFLAGCYLRGFALNKVPGAGALMTAVCGALALATIGGVAFFDAQGIAPVAFAIRIVAVVIGCLVAAQLVRWWPGRVLAGLGRETLQVYVLHMMVISPIVLALTALGGLPRGASLVMPVIVCAIAVAIPLGAHWVFTRAGFLRYAFEQPSWLSGKPRRKSSPSSAR